MLSLYYCIRAITQSQPKSQTFCYNSSMIIPEYTPEILAANELYKNAITNDEKFAARQALKLAYLGTNPQYNAEQLAANELRKNAITREEKDIATKALKLAFLGLRPGIAAFTDGEEII